MKCLTLIAALAVTPAFADTPVAPDKILVMACLENLEQGTTWHQCVELMFQPCVSHDAGGAAHATCLQGERAAWAGTVENLQTQVVGMITIGGVSELTELMGQWTGYVVQGCEKVAASKPEGMQSARLGCEISEMAGLSGELAACLEGRSSAEYCKFKEQ